MTARTIPNKELLPASRPPPLAHHHSGPLRKRYRQRHAVPLNAPLFCRGVSMAFPTLGNQAPSSRGRQYRSQLGNSSPWSSSSINTSSWFPTRESRLSAPMALLITGSRSFRPSEISSVASLSISLAVPSRFWWHHMRNTEGSNKG